MNKKKQEFDFENALERLNTIVSALDSEETKLRESVSLYEEGIGLVTSCLQELSAVQTQLLELRKRAEGVFDLVQLEDHSL
jgi:exodeoxyribonuclease VII small subunit